MSDSRGSWFWPLIAWWKKPRPRPIVSELMDGVGVVSYLLVPFACLGTALYLAAPLMLNTLPKPAESPINPKPLPRDQPQRN